MPHVVAEVRCVNSAMHRRLTPSGSGLPVPWVHVRYGCICGKGYSVFGLTLVRVRSLAYLTCETTAECRSSAASAGSRKPEARSFLRARAQAETNWAWDL